jgi:hypothetical protein
MKREQQEQLLIRKLMQRPWRREKSDQLSQMTWVSTTIYDAEPGVKMHDTEPAATSVTPSRLPRRCHAGNHVYTCLEPRRHDP